MNVNLITQDELVEFRKQLLNDVKEIISNNTPQQKKWLKSSEVRKLLNISAGTLQTLRINGSLNYTKIGAIIYYNYSDIEKLLNGNGQNKVFQNHNS